ncbi:E3 ubiquitin-protein ligase TRIM17-like isoform X1 [Xiphophorus couchianus]|uniref:E3 ubiquitin-protein ligase TRIM17-like isoform X1 n=1 Tax=Xiphophorus couchianus TaxID=32473 RepID=UPI001015F686|nr:E3 ubiquitin-protein ligase TRIM17-like isoform X1 [Xiphophorus couchianus]XP_027893728.1 E3 ubiquitin-protein ligase TRIM17-like isoform X1 [Xiphophorus couchianus]
MSTHCILTSPPEEHLRCSLCLDLFTEPVTTTCGHSFCRTCLSQRWSDGDCYQCPKCNKRFPVKPEFSTNEVMEEMSVQLKRRKTEALESENAPWQVKCDVCADLRFKASKSCLVCLASYCDGHLESHRRVPALMRHKLVEPLENLEERVCEKHARILEFFCRREQACVCLLCCEAEHRDHETVPVEEEGALQKETIDSQQTKIKLMIDERMEKIEEFQKTSEMSKVKADNIFEDGEKLFSILMSRVQEIQSKLQSNIEKELRKSKETVQAMIQELNEEVAALQMKHSQLDELSQKEDNLRLLQTLQTLNTMSKTKDWSETKVYPDLFVHTTRTAMEHLVNCFQTTLRTLTNMELTKMREYKESVTFDESTAGAGLKITDSGKRLKYSKTAMSPTPSSKSQRFALPMVFGANGFISGRHYWEVQVGLRNNWHIGVALEMVDRSPHTVYKDSGFYFLGKSGFDYEVRDSACKVLHLSPRPTHVGVYLDYEAGRVSFFDVTQKLHIYSFLQEHFTGKLFPYFYLHSGTKRSEPLLLLSILDPEYYLRLIRSLDQAKKPAE